MRYFKNKILTILIAVTAMFGIAGIGPALTGDVPMVYAQNAIGEAREGAGSVGNQNAGGVNRLIRSVLNILSWVVGVVSVIMIIVGGLRYTLSNGDSGAIQGAKNTIIYAIIGLIIAIFAQAIVQFVLSNV